jgi:hypothetical protein
VDVVVVHPRRPTPSTDLYRVEKSLARQPMSQSLITLTDTSRDSLSQKALEAARADGNTHEEYMTQKKCELRRVAKWLYYHDMS